MSCKPPVHTHHRLSEAMQLTSYSRHRLYGYSIIPIIRSCFLFVKAFFPFVILFIRFMLHRPLPANRNSCAGWMIPVLLVKIRIGIKLLTGNIRALPAMTMSPVLTAPCNRTCSIKGISPGFDTAAAAMAFPKTAVFTVQTAPGINHFLSPGLS